MNLRRFGVLLAALVLATLPSFAQEQTGSIEGVITDATSAVVPGATVEARSASGSVQSAVTDAQGRYTFRTLPSGTYQITASLTGFSTVKFADVRLSLGQSLRVDLSLRVSTVQEEVTVTGETPIVDVTGTTRSTSIRDEFVDKLPKGRDFTTLAAQAPGANIEFKTGGLSIDGASSSENKYIIDGIETNDPNTGLSGQNLVTDMVDEVQVKASGYPAEYSGAVGGVVNVVTKSGTNNFKGSVWGYLSGDRFGFSRGPAFGAGTSQAPQYADSRQSLRLSPTNSNVAEYINYNKDSISQFEPGFAFGGPIKKDKAWFFLSYNPTLRSIDRNVTLTTGEAVSGSETRRTHSISANISASPSDNLRTRFAFNSTKQTVDGELPALAGSDSPGLDYTIFKEGFPNWSATANADYVVSPKFFMSARVGYFLSDDNTTGNFQGDRYLYINSNIGGCSGCPAVPAQFQHPTNFSNATAASHTETVNDKFTRLSLQTDATWFLDAAGQHEFKFGVQYDQLKNNVLSRETGNYMRLYWGRSTSGQRGAYGYYRLRTNTTHPERGFETVGDTVSNNLGLFIQDSWTIGKRLTLNLGVRTERERVGNYDPTSEASVSTGFGDTLFEFPFSAKIAPRLGFAYDVMGNGKTKVYGSWGLFYDIMKLALPRGSFGGDKWTDVYGRLDSPDPASLSACQVNSTGAAVNCPGAIRTVDFRHPSFEYLELDADGKPVIDPYRIQEFSGGVEHSLSANVSVALRYVHKQIDKAIEDIGYVNANGDEVYLIGNPGFHANEIAWVTGAGTQIPAPKAVRDYNSIEAVFNRRLANNWALRFSYLWSRLNGNYSGLAQGDEPGRADPNVGRLFDAPFIMFDQTGNATFGPLPTDRPHQVKAQFIYEFGFGLSTGVNGYLSSGAPVSREAAFLANGYPVQYAGRGSDGRTPMLKQVDLNVNFDIKLGSDRRKLQLMANVLNVLNSQTATSLFPTETAAGITVGMTEDQFFAGFNGTAAVAAAGPRDPRFLQPAQFQNPREIRLGLRFVF